MNNSRRVVHDLTWNHHAQLSLSNALAALAAKNLYYNIGRRFENLVNSVSLACFKEVTLAYSEISRYVSRMNA